MKRLVQAELMAGLFAMSVATGIPTALAMALHVSPDFTTTVGPVQVGGCTRKHKRAGERSAGKSSKSLRQKGEQL
jgi:hypothetical protein